MHRLVLTALLVAVFSTAPLFAESEPVERIAAGSCNRQDLQQPLWGPILAFQPQVWVWLGDNIYGDTDDMSVLAAKWDEQKRNPGYAKLASQATVLGTWDDHDYGKNDAGFEYRKRRESQKLFLDFLGEPADSPRRGHAGVYDARFFGPPGRRLGVVLLDVRFFRAPRKSGGDILGEAQWRWLARTLKSSDAQVHLICSGSQILPTEQRHEKWADYPESRDRLFKLLADSGKGGFILLSGDRHFGEISKITNPHGGGELLELTTSGLTHFWKGFPGEPNALRLGDPYVDLNFGTVEIDWEKREATIAIRDAEGAAVRTASTGF
jgi:alkaline phosphatase D